MRELALYIDIEGFSFKFENGGKKSFINLTNDLYSLGRSLLSYLSIIQFGGDGFLIKEIIIYRNEISRFIDLSAALLQIITIRGGAGRVQISHGYMSDISGLYSDEILKEIHVNNQNILGGCNHNVMLINPIIGTSIIKSYKLKGPKGPLLLVDKDLKEMLEDECIYYETIPYDKSEVLSINWLKLRNKNIEHFLKQLKLNSDNIEEVFRIYINNNELTSEWEENAWKLIG
jgi:hypothetical protein